MELISQINRVGHSMTSRASMVRELARKFLPRALRIRLYLLFLSLTPPPTDGLGRYPREREAVHGFLKKNKANTPNQNMDTWESELFKLLGKYPRNLQLLREKATFLEAAGRLAEALDAWEKLSKKWKDSLLVQRRFLKVLRRVAPERYDPSYAEAIAERMASADDAALLPILAELDGDAPDDAVVKLEQHVSKHRSSYALNTLVTHKLSTLGQKEALEYLNDLDISAEERSALEPLLSTLQVNVSRIVRLDEEALRVRKVTHEFFDQAKKHSAKPDSVIGRDALMTSSISDPSTGIIVQSIADYLIRKGRANLERTRDISIVVADLEGSDSDIAAKLKQPGVWVTNLKLYPSKRAKGTIDPVAWVDDFLIDFPSEFIRKVKAVSLLLIDKPVHQIIVTDLQMCEIAVLGAAAAGLPAPTFLALGDPFGRTTSQAIGIISCALEIDRCNLVYDQDITESTLDLLELSPGKSIIRVCSLNSDSYNGSSTDEESIRLLKAFKKTLTTKRFFFGMVGGETIYVDSWLKVAAPILRSNPFLKAAIVCPDGIRGYLEEKLLEQSLRNQVLVLQEGIDIQPWLFRSMATCVAAESDALKFLIKATVVGVPVLGVSRRLNDFTDWKSVFSCSPGLDQEQRLQGVLRSWVDNPNSWRAGCRNMRIRRTLAQRAEHYYELCASLLDQSIGSG